jgi:hypothetical protein
MEIGSSWVRQAKPCQIIASQAPRRGRRFVGERAKRVIMRVLVKDGPNQVQHFVFRPVDFGSALL